MILFQLLFHRLSIITYASIRNIEFSYWHIAKVANDTSDQAICVIVVKVDYVE